MDIVLIPGLWLDGAVWDRTAAALADKGHRVQAVTLPGQGDDHAAATYDDQVAAVDAAVADAERPLVVGHSAAATLAWVAADRHPDAVARVAMIGGFPTADGEAYAAFFPCADGVMAWPGWEPFEGPDSSDLDEAARADFTARTVTVPEAVVTGTVHLGDERRFDVPVTMICPEFSPDEAREAVGTADDDPPSELARARSVDYVDIDSGHWPMLTRSDELADLIDAVAARTS